MKDEMKAFIAALALTLAGCDHGRPVSQPSVTGLSITADTTVATVLSYYKVELDDCELYDEPPGVLSIVRFQCPIDGVVYRIGMGRNRLFSETLTYPSGKLMSAPVVAMVEDNRKREGSPKKNWTLKDDIISLYD